MTHVNSFFNPVTYNRFNTVQEFLLDKVDDYFYLGGKKAYVVKNAPGSEEVLIFDSNSSLLGNSAKFISYFTIIIPLFMLAAKAALHFTHKFTVIESKDLFSSNLNVPEEATLKVYSLIEKILKTEECNEIKLLSNAGNILKLNKYAHLVFKFAKFGNSPSTNNESINSRFKNMIKAKKVCLINNLDLLIVPQAIKTTLCSKDFPCIIEEAFDFPNNESANEKDYETHSKSLNETMRQLAVFVAKTGFNDVTWRNVPIVNEREDFLGPRRVALIDLEHMIDAESGFMGSNNGSCGLIRCCTSEEQIDIVIKEARKQNVGISEEDLQSAKKLRLKELESNKKIIVVYKKNNIITGKEPINVDLDSLGLDLSEKAQDEFCFEDKPQIFTLRKATEDLIKEINRLIQQASDEASPKCKRTVFLNTDIAPFNLYNRLGCPNYFSASVKELKKTWINQIITALIDKEYIVKLNEVNEYGYLIQA